MQTVAGRSITYRRGTRTVSLVGWVDSHAYQVFDGDGVMVNYTSDDWTVKTSELKFGTEAITPTPGDRIEETLNGTAIIWEVMPPAGAATFEWLDTSNTMTLIHTKRVQ